MRSKVTCTAELERMYLSDCFPVDRRAQTSHMCHTGSFTLSLSCNHPHTRVQLHVLPPEQQGTRSEQPSGPGHSCLLPVGDYLVHSGTFHSSGRPKTPGRRAQPHPIWLPPSLPSFPPAPARHPRSPVLPLRRPSYPLLSRLEMERGKVAPLLELLAPSPWPRGF